MTFNLKHQQLTGLNGIEFEKMSHSNRNLAYMPRRRNGFRRYRSNYLLTFIGKKSRIHLILTVITKRDKHINRKIIEAERLHAINFRVIFIGDGKKR